MMTRRERERSMFEAARAVGLTMHRDGDGYRLSDASAEPVPPSGSRLSLDDVEFYVGHEPVHRRRVAEFAACVRAERGRPVREDPTLRAIDEAIERGEAEA